MNTKGLFANIPRALCALGMVFLSACSPACRQWTLAQTTTNYPCFNSGRLYLEPDAKCHHIELELARGASGLRMYLNLHLFPAAPLPEDESRTSAELIVNEKEPLVFYPYCLLGGQRLLIPDDITAYLIELLNEEQTVLIKVGRDEIAVVPDNFQSCYQSLMAIPISN